MTKPEELQTQILISISPEQLRGIIRDEIKKAVEEVTTPPLYGKFVSRREAADILSVSTRTIANYDKSGALQRHILPGNNIRYLQSEVNRLAIQKGKKIDATKSRNGTRAKKDTYRTKKAEGY